MKIINGILPMLAIAGIALSGLGCQNSGSGDKTAAGETTQSTQANDVQKATVIVDNGFSPTTIDAVIGKPVEITFDTKSRGCADEVVFKTLNMRKALTDGTKTVVTFTPTKAGNYDFACPMDMYKGAVVVK